MSNRYVGIILILLIFFVQLIGCIFSAPYTEKTEKSVDLQPLKIQGCLSVHEKDAWVIPFMSPLIKNRDMDVQINNSSPSVSDNPSLFSARLAIAFWRQPEKVFIVSLLEDAAVVSTIATLSNSPILLDTDISILNKAIEMLEPKEIIRITDWKETIKLTIDLYHQNDININYGILINIEDEKAPHLSFLSPLFANLRNGVIIPGSTNVTTTLAHISVAHEIFSRYNFSLRYLLLLGNPNSIPFIPAEGGNITISDGEKTDIIVTDNYYGDIDDDPLITELSIGRIAVSSLNDAFSLFKRYSNYANYFEDSAIGWQNIASICGASYDVAAFSSYSMVKTETTFATAGFIPLFYAESPVIGAIEKSNSQRLTEMSNFVFFVAHGSADSQEPFIDWDNARLHPSVIFNTGCRIGGVDMVPYSKSVVCKIFHNGGAALIASTRLTIAGIGVDSAGNIDSGINALGRLFFEELIKDVSVGDALRLAKERYVNEIIPDDKVVPYGTVLYGDPAFNPYEPCNEGKSL